MQVDTLKLLVDRRLRTWSYEIGGATLRVGDGFPTVNMLHPLAGVSFASSPDISDETLLTDAILHEAMKEAREPVIVLRASYLCRSNVIERQRRCAQWALGMKLGRRRFLTLYDIGFDIVRCFFEFDAKTMDTWTAWLNRLKESA